MDTLSLVAEFHRAFNMPINPTPTVLLDSDAEQQRAVLRFELLQEELDELRLAWVRGSKVGILDALTDLQYVLDGTYLEFGMGALKEVAFQDVHDSNMSKLGEDGLPLKREDGKILKGPNYRPPQLGDHL